MSQFAQAITQFNSMYRMPVADSPTLINKQRLVDFKSILGKELDEIDDIIDNYDTAHPLATLTALADLLGDIQVYCASEMAKHGLPLDETLTIIMESNFSKMGADGLPIYDEQGKLQKGPNYWKPEPYLERLLRSSLVV